MHLPLLCVAIDLTHLMSCFLYVRLTHIVLKLLTSHYVLDFSIKPGASGRIGARLARKCTAHALKLRQFRKKRPLSAAPVDSELTAGIVHIARTSNRPKCQKFKNGIVRKCIAVGHDVLRDARCLTCSVVFKRLSV